MLSSLFGLSVLLTWVGWALRVALANPESTKLRIKRDLEGERKRVVVIKRRSMFFENRGLRFFRTYVVTTEERGWNKERRVGVEAVWFSDPEVRHYDDCWQRIQPPGIAS